MIAGPRVAIAIPTIERPLAVERLVRSARRHLPELQVYVGDQGRPDPFMDEFYRRNDVRLVRLPYDCGVAEARNAIVAQIEEPYFLLCDDDFVLGEGTGVADALTILEAAPDIGVVGGKLVDAFTGGAATRYADRLYEMRFMLDPANRLLVSFPLHLFAPEPRIVAGFVCYPCDALLNFAVFRRAIFSDRVKWDSRFKSDGEHEDFYLNLKVNSEWTAVYLPTLLAEHERPETVAYQRKRQRTGGWSGMMQKWGIDQYLEFGAGLRTIGEIGAFHHDFELSRPRFLTSGKLTYAPSEGTQEGAFEVDDERGLRSLRTYDPLSGQALVQPVALNGSLDAGPGRTLAATAAKPAPRALLEREPGLPTLIAVTIDRPQAVQRFVRTARARFPNIRVLIGDQSAPDPFMDSFYRHHDIEVERLPYDFGLSATRNRLVQRLAEDDYFVLCDDDFVFTGETDFRDAMAILNHRSDIGIVGGQLRDLKWRDGTSRMLDWAMMVELDQRAGLLAFIPMHHFAPVVDTVAGIQYYRCDAVANFAVFRRSIFSDTIRWDPTFRSDGEHEDFYINLKLNADVGVVHLPSMVAEHHRPEASAYERKRFRSDGWPRLMRKWGIRQYLEVGAGLRTLGAVDPIQPQRTLKRSSFHLGGTLRHGSATDSREGTFDIGRGEMLPLHTYSATGQGVFDRNIRMAALIVGETGLEPREPAQ